MTVKETYHADCLRIRQLEQQLADTERELERKEEIHLQLLDDREKQEQQLARYQKFHDYIVQNEQWINDIWLEKFIKEFESEQNERKSV